MRRLNSGQVKFYILRQFCWKRQEKFKMSKLAEKQHFFWFWYYVSTVRDYRLRPSLFFVHKFDFFWKTFTIKKIMVKKWDNGIQKSATFSFFAGKKTFKKVSSLQMKLLLCLISSFLLWFFQNQMMNWVPNKNTWNSAKIWINQKSSMFISFR